MSKVMIIPNETSLLPVVKWIVGKQHINIKDVSGAKIFLG